MTEAKEPYYSLKVHIGESLTAKTLGIKTRSIEVTYGNMETVTINNPDDIAHVIKSTPIAEKVWEAWDDVTARGKDRGHKFVEDIVGDKE